MYDSDNPIDYPLNSYHLNSRPRILLLEDFNEQGEIICLELECMCFDQKNDAKSRELENLQLSYHDRKKQAEFM